MDDRRGLSRGLSASCAFALKFAVELGLGLAEFACEAFERLFLVDAGYGLKTGYAGRDGFARGGISLPGPNRGTWGTQSRCRRCFDEQN